MLRDRQPLDHLGIGVRGVDQGGIHQTQGLGAALRPESEEQVGLGHPADPLQAGELRLLRGQGTLGGLRVPGDPLDGAAALTRLPQVGTHLLLTGCTGGDLALERRYAVIVAIVMTIALQHLSRLRAPPLGDQEAAKGVEGDGILGAAEIVAQQAQCLVGAAAQPQHPRQLDEGGSIARIKGRGLAQQGLGLGERASADPDEGEVVVKHRI